MPSETRQNRQSRGKETTPTRHRSGWRDALENVDAISHEVAHINTAVVDAELTETGCPGDFDDLANQAVRQREDVDVLLRRHEHVVRALDRVHRQATRAQLLVARLR